MGDKRILDDLRQCQANLVASYPGGFSSRGGTVYERAEAEIRRLHVDLSDHRADMERIRIDYDMAGNCLQMIAERLELHGCCHGHDGKATPAMMYDDWITCAIRKARQDGLADAAWVNRAHWACHPPEETK